MNYSTTLYLSPYCLIAAECVKGLEIRVYDGNHFACTLNPVSPDLNTLCKQAVLVHKSCV